MLSFDVFRVQGSGVGGLHHNSVFMGWPHKWRTQPKFSRAFIGKLRCHAKTFFATYYTESSHRTADVDIVNVILK